MTSYYHSIQRYFRTTTVLPVKKALLLTIIPAAAVFLSSCDEKPTDIGAGLLPESDNVSMLSIDTIKVESYNVYVDSVYSGNKAYSYLGGLYDPYFGHIYSDFVSQLRLTKKWDSGEPIVDSVELFIPVSGAKGNFATEMEITLKEITDQLYADTLYYSNRTPKTSTDFGTYLLPKFVKDTVKAVIIDLPDTVGKYLLRDLTKLNQEGGANDFRTFFKGLYVSAREKGKPTQIGSFPHLPLMITTGFGTGDFRIRVYYHTSTATSLVFDFIINNNSIRYNRYLHDFSTADPVRGIKHINDNFRDTISHMQGFYGVFTRIRIPDLEKVRSMMPVSVNKTRFTFSVYLDDDIYKPTTMPSRIYMSYTSASGARAIVPDYYVSTSYFDGTFNSSTKKYSFNLSAFAQEYLEGRIPQPIVDLYFPEGEYRNAILKANNASAPVKFEFVYTRF